MNWHIIKVIISHEYFTKVKKKSFLLVTFLGPIFFAIFAFAPALIMVFSKDTTKKVLVVDNSGIVKPYLQSNKEVEFTVAESTNIEELKQSLKSLNEDGLLVISALDTLTKSVNSATYSYKPLGEDVEAYINSKINTAIEDYRISQYNIKDLSAIMASVKYKNKITTYLIDDKGGSSISSNGVYTVISLGLGMIIYLFISMFCGMVMSSVIEEKTSRVVEVLVSSVKATELMFGKIIGIAMVAITQFVLWIVLTCVIVSAGYAIFDVSNANSTPVVNAVVGDVMLNSLDVNSTNIVANNAPTSELAVVLNTIFQLDIITILVSFAFYFVFGYLLYASLFAAVGSSVENQADAAQLQLPITIPLMIGFFIVLNAFKAPDGAIAIWGSMIPFTSPIVMLARIPYGVPFWQLSISISILILTFIVFAWASAKIYRVGILMYGKKTTWKDLFKWLKQD